MKCWVAALALAALAQTLCAALPAPATQITAHMAPRVRRVGQIKAGVHGDESFADVVDDLAPPISSRECVIHMAAQRAALAGAAHWMGLSGVTENTRPLEQGMTW